MTSIQTTTQVLRELKTKLGAIFSENSNIALSFGSQQHITTTLAEGLILCDRSHWGLIRLAGVDRLRFLHNQTTNNIQALKPGGGCETVFVTSTGRTLELATVWATEEELLILVSPQRRQRLLDWMDRYIFPMDKVELSDLSNQYAIFTLLGTGTQASLSQLGLASILDQPQAHQLATLGEVTGRIAIGSGLALAGFTLLIPIAQALSVWQYWIGQGALPIGDRDWDALRIQQGRPAPDQELTEDYNPLEAGLWRAISFTKGCYIGQETIARLNTYQGVKQRLWGLKLDQVVARDTILTLAGDKVGIVTSCLETEQGIFGLGYIKTKAGGAGLTVQVQEATAEVVAVPYLSHDYPTPENR